MNEADLYVVRKNIVFIRKKEKQKERKNKVQDKVSNRFLIFVFKKI